MATEVGVLALADDFVGGQGESASSCIALTAGAIEPTHSALWSHEIISKVE